MDDLINIVDLARIKQGESWVGGPRAVEPGVKGVKRLAKDEPPSEEDPEWVKEHIDSLTRRAATVAAKQARIERDIKDEVTRRKATLSTRIDTLKDGQPIVPGNKTMRQKLEELRAELDRDGEGVIKAHLDKLEKAAKRATERTLKNGR